MAAVWLAYDDTLLREVAIKFVWSRDQRRQDAMVGAFLREARIAASVVHRNVVQVLDFGTLTDSTPFMVMEALKGKTLGDMFNDGAQFDMHEIVQIISRSLDGLIAVHQAGIVHRDLKPENIFLTKERDGYFPKLLDFGISRSLDTRFGRRSAVTTRDGRIVGTPEYMSPEQAAGTAAVDRRTDIYSMGVIIYETINGDVPYKSNHMGDLILQITRGEARPIVELVPEVGGAISDVVSKAMRPDPNQRFADAEEMSKAFAAAAKSVQPLADILPERGVNRLNRTRDFESGEPEEASVPTLSLPAHLRRGRAPDSVAAAALKTQRDPPLDMPTTSGAPTSGPIALKPRAVKAALVWVAASLVTMAALALFLLKVTPHASGGNKFIVVQGNQAGAAHAPALTAATTAPANEVEVEGLVPEPEPPPDPKPTPTNSAPRKPRRLAEANHEESVARAFSRQMAPVVRCFESLEESEVPQVSVRVTIDQRGRVAESQVSPSSGISQVVGECIRGAVATMRFAPQPTPTTYRVPLIARRGS